MNKPDYQFIDISKMPDWDSLRREEILKLRSGVDWDNIVFTGRDPSFDEIISQEITKRMALKDDT